MKKAKRQGASSTKPPKTPQQRGPELDDEALVQATGGVAKTPSPAGPVSIPYPNTVG